MNKKILLLTTTLLSLFYGTTFVSAANAALTASVYGPALSVDSSSTLSGRVYPITNHNPIYSNDDLYQFIQSLIDNNTSFKTITTENDRVTVVRNIPTKLFGFIPIKADETAEVISLGDGTMEVKVNRSWWSMFSKSDVNLNLISSQIEAKLNTIPEAEFKTDLTTTTKARILSEIQAIFDANMSLSSIIITQ